MGVYCISEHIISPLGDNTEHTFQQMKAGVSGIQKHHDPSLFPEPVYIAQIKNPQAGFKKHLTRLENLIIYSISEAIQKLEPEEDTVLFLASTKGNINYIKSQPERVSLGCLGQRIKLELGLTKEPVVVSNACISGVSAILMANDWLKNNRCKRAVVCGADEISAFTISGFNSFQALASENSKPFDKNRTGLNLGEAVGTLVLSKEKGNALFNIAGGGQSNDANHISGPSRTGEGLKRSILKALEESETKVEEIDYINAHGTATIFNDEMESKAFANLGFSHTPLNSVKGYFGHTLGAAGLIETILCMKQMEHQCVLANFGYQNHGVSGELNISNKNRAATLSCVLKTASGFGGVNAAVILKRC